MSVSAFGSGHTAPASREKAEGPCPDHGSDSDNAGTAQTQAPAATAAWYRQVVNKIA